MKRILTTLLLATAFVACKKQKPPPTPLPDKLVRYFAFYGKGSVWTYRDTANNASTTLTAIKAQPGENLTNNKRMFVANFLSSKDSTFNFSYELTPTSIDINTTKVFTTNWLWLNIANDSFYTEDGSTKIETFSTIEIAGNAYTDVLHYTHKGSKITDMWFAPYKGLIQFKTTNNTYKLIATDIK